MSKQSAPCPATERFTSRVDDYVRSRPGYPPQVVELLRERLGLQPPAALADMGCGTGLLARPLLEAGYDVTGIEPNASMRAAGERLLRDFARFRMVAASAEQTSLPPASFDAIVVGQAFHWFDAQAAGTEFARLLKPRGWIVLVWNERDTESSAFLRDYEMLLLRHCPAYTRTRGQYVAREAVDAFFSPGRCELAVFDNHQNLDLDGLCRRLQSSSYVPNQGPDSRRVLRAARELFEHHAHGGQVRLAYQTVVYYGRLDSRVCGNDVNGRP